jgi:hypothetical protein
VGASQRTKKCLDDYRRGVESLKAANPLELHILFIDTAIASWTPYIADLTKAVVTLVSIRKSSSPIPDKAADCQSRSDDDWGSRPS